MKFFGLTADPVVTFDVSKACWRPGFWIWCSDQLPYLGRLPQQTYWFYVPSTCEGCPFAGQRESACHLKRQGCGSSGALGGKPTAPRPSSFYGGPSLTP